MYPEILISTLFIVSPTTIEHFASSAIDLLQELEWAIPVQWMNSANNWEHFPGGVVPVAGIDETSLFVY